MNIAETGQGASSEVVDWKEALYNVSSETPVLQEESRTVIPYIRSIVIVILL